MKIGLLEKNVESIDTEIARQVAIEKEETERMKQAMENQERYSTVCTPFVGTHTKWTPNIVRCPFCVKCYVVLCLCCIMLCYVVVLLSVMLCYVCVGVMLCYVCVCCVLWCYV